MFVFAILVRALNHIRSVRENCSATLSKAKERMLERKVISSFEKGMFTMLTSVAFGGFPCQSTLL